MKKIVCWACIKPRADKNDVPIFVIHEHQRLAAIKNGYLVRPLVYLEEE